MAYPLIILGAGASYDYLDRPIAQNLLGLSNYTKFRAPLLREVFDARFSNILKNHDQSTSLATEISNAISRGEDFEEYLTNLRNKHSDKDKRLQQQMVSMLFYLRDLFNQISNNYYHPSNHYNDLLQQIGHYCEDRACFINFNYDLLLEKSIERHDSSLFSSKQIHDYVHGKIKIVKLHGACNWLYGPIEIREVDPKQETAEGYLTKRAEDVLKGLLSTNLGPQAKDFQNNPEYNESIGWTVHLPALALPLKDKTHYVCPDSHLEILKDEIQKIDRLLIIGWRAGDPFLLEFLGKNIKSNRITATVVGGKNIEQEVMVEFRKTVPQLKVKKLIKGGFDSFMKSEYLTEFFNQ